jgi:hypothetical protein
MSQKRDFIDDHKIENIVFLICDHCKMSISYRVGGSMIGVNNIVKLAIIGPRNDREFSFEFFDSNWKLLLTKNLN